MQESRSIVTTTCNKQKEKYVCSNEEEEEEKRKNIHPSSLLFIERNNDDDVQACGHKRIYFYLLAFSLCLSSSYHFSYMYFFMHAMSYRRREGRITGGETG